MKIKELFNIQKELDERIRKEHQLEEENLVAHKVLALQVELGELANETRCFKYWSKKGPSERAVILEEYVDCLHFILSIGLELGYGDIDLATDEGKEEATTLFLKAYSDLSALYTHPTKENYQNFWGAITRLGATLGFTWEEITEAYLKKNEINHQRQVEGY